VKITFTQTGVYPLTYSAITAEGCTDFRRDSIYVYDDLAVYVPTAFSPNEDGINEIFIPVTTGFDSTQYNFTLYNRWGQLIFESNSPGEGWEGKNGIQDVYIWKLTGRSNMGVDHSFSGYTTLIR
jgi:gliding motility-associated-like protein